MKGGMSKLLKLVGVIAIALYAMSPLVQTAVKSVFKSSGGTSA